MSNPSLEALFESIEGGEVSPPSDTTKEAIELLPLRDNDAILPTFSLNPKLQEQDYHAILHSCLSSVGCGNSRPSYSVFDFESFFDEKAGYSLSKMSIPEYVRDPRFKVTALAMSRPFEDANILIAHNAAFDLFVLAHDKPHVLESPKLFLCTRMLASLLRTQDTSFSPPSLSLRDLSDYFGHGAKGYLEAVMNQDELEAYNELDVRLTVQLFHSLMTRLARIMPAPILRRELLMIHSTLYMMAKPKFVLDGPTLHAVVKESNEAKANDPFRGKGSKTKKKAALLDAGIPEEELTTLNKQHLQMLREKYSLTPEAVAAIDDIIGNQAKDEAPRAKKWLAIGSPMPVPLKYLGAHTGRWSGDAGINMQNLPRGSVMRKALQAPEGHELVIADLAQVEARVLAYLADDKELLAQFEAGVDVYKAFASEVYGVPIEDVTKPQRQVAKSAVLGLGYGMGADKFQRYCSGSGITISEEEAQRIVAVYRSARPAITQYWRDCNNALYSFLASGIMLPVDMLMELPWTGRCLRYNNVRYTEDGELCYDEPIRGYPKRLYGGVIVENIVQAVARDVLADIIIGVAEYSEYWPSHCVHDELIYIVPEEYSEQVGNLLVYITSRIQPWLKMEAHVSKVYDK